MNDYFTQPHLPTIEADLNDKGSFIIKQFDNKWNVPLFLDNQTVIWLLKNGSLCPSPNAFNEPKMPVLNYKSYSFAIMKYSLSYWSKLLETDLTKTDESTLMGLIQDLDRQIRHRRLIIIDLKYGI